MKQWEYKILETTALPIAEIFNNWGIHGWELCSSYRTEYDGKFYYTFKRELVTKPEEKI